MRGRSIRLLLAALLIAIAAATGCGGEERAFRIGVLNDCIGIFRALDDAELSGAQLPLIERGARLLGRRPGEGISTAYVAGRPVELVRACSETLEFTTLFQEVRRLVEIERVDAIVAGTLGVDGLAVREVARLYPDVAFIASPTGTREVTLRRRAPNVYRVAADHGQTVAGLAAYAFSDLGWRSAAVMATNWDIGWGEAAAFVAEFCALGGRVTQVRIDFLDPTGKDAGLTPRDVDGVAVLTNGILGPQTQFVRRLAERIGSPQRRMVLGPYVTSDEGTLRALGGRLHGVVGASLYPPPSASRGMRDHVRSYTEAFPGLSSELARGELVIAYRNGVDALLQAFESADGDLSDGRRRLHEQLAGLDTDLAGQRVRLDENGQAVTTSTLVRVGQAASGGSLPRLTVVRSIQNVDQSVGGLLAPELRPSAADAPCRRATPPPWAR